MNENKFIITVLCDTRIITDVSSIFLNARNDIMVYTKNNSDCTTIYSGEDSKFRLKEAQDFIKKNPDYLRYVLDFRTDMN